MQKRAKNKGPITMAR